MLNKGYLRGLPFELRILVSAFIFVLSIGYFTGMVFVKHTSEMTPAGIVDNYNGNEGDDQANEMKFKKSHHEMLNILHTHFLSLSIIFFILGILVYGCELNVTWFHKFLILEPTISVFVTFSSIYLVWLGIESFTYVVLFSGILMTFSYILSIILIGYNLFKGHSHIT